MKAFHIADTHIKEGQRWNECRRVLDHFARRVEQEKPEVVLHAGDLFDARSTPNEMSYAEQWVQRIANVCPFVIVPGNHDNWIEIESLGRLQSEYSILPLVRPGVMTVAGLNVLAMPWPTLSSVIQDSQYLATAGEEAADHLRAIMQKLGSTNKSFPKIGLMHAMVNGSLTSHGQPLRGFDFSLSLEDLRWLKCDAVALGHIHRAQGWSKNIDEWTARYCGSPFHTDFGDYIRNDSCPVHDQPSDKSFTIWNYESSGISVFPDIEVLPAHQMLECKTDFNPDEGVIAFDAGKGPLQFEDVEFKLTYSFKPEDSAGAHRAAKAWKFDAVARGAYSVTLNPVSLASTAARIPEVSTATTPIDKLLAYMKSRGDDLDSEQAQRILEKFNSIIEE